MPTLKPLGHQSVNYIVFFVLISANAALTYLGIISPLYETLQVKYFPFYGSHLIIKFSAENKSFVISVTEGYSYAGLYVDWSGEYEADRNLA